MSDYFGAVDYLVLVLMLMISTCIGLFFAWKDRKNTDEDEFLRGGKHMSTIPVCISIMASFLPSTSFIGFPTVIYAQGTMFWTMVFVAGPAAFVAGELFIPVFYNMDLTSVNEYLLKRFNSKPLQVAANISSLLAYIPFFGVEMFAPAIALSIVTDMSITSCIFVIGVIVTLYTSLGGLKGVIWTDFFQFSVMVFGLFAVIIRGAHVSGGMASVFQKAHAGGRIEFWNMDFDIYAVNSFWGYFLGFGLLWMATFSTSQLQIQRAVCMPSLASAKKALYFAIPGYTIILSLVCLTGVVMYARFYDCDPMLTGRVTRPDQILPFFVLDIFEDDYKGLPGAFVSCIFGSSLSTLSSGLNGMATIVWDDYAKKFFHRMPDKYSVFATRGLAALIGVISIALAFVIKESDNIVEAAVSIYGASCGPMFAIFCLGLFFPWSNAIGGLTALIVGQSMCLWATIGWVSDKRPMTSLALGLSTDACAERNITVFLPGAPLAFLKDYKIPEYHPEGIEVIHHINPFFIPFFGFLVSLIVGNVVSLATKGNRDRKVDVNLVNLKVCYYMEKLVPQSWRQFQDLTTRQRQQDSKVADRVTTINNTLNKPNGTMEPTVELKRMQTDSYYLQEDGPEDKEATLPLRGSRPSIDRTTNI